MKMNYITPAIIIEFVETECILAASPTVEVTVGDDVEITIADTKEHRGNRDVWENNDKR